MICVYMHTYVCQSRARSASVLPPMFMGPVGLRSQRVATTASWTTDDAQHLLPGPSHILVYAIFFSFEFILLKTQLARSLKNNIANVTNPSGL